MRIFIGMNEIAGYNLQLAKGLNELGIQAHFFNLQVNKFYQTNDLAITRHIAWALKTLRLTQNKKGINKLVHYPIRLYWHLIKIIFMFWALIKFDVFIFSGIESLYYLRDLALLKFMKKKIIFVFHGSDARPVYMNGKYLSSKPNELKNTLDYQKSQLEIIEKFADYIICHPAFGHLLKKPFIQWYCLGMPFELNSDNTTEKAETNNTSTTKILHAPSAPEVKGTAEIRKCIENLKNRGYNIDFIEITGKPHNQVLKAIQDCDFVVDEIYSDSLMAGLDREAAYFGKPFIVAGYLKPEDVNELPQNLLPPSNYCHPDELEETIEKLIINIDFRQQLGTKLQSFVKSIWTPHSVAKRYLQLINSDFPEQWYYPPEKTRYFHGFGMNEEKARYQLNKILENYGKEGFLLQHNEKLLNIIIEFINYDK